jgi:CBS domain-containing protein
MSLVKTELKARDVMTPEPVCVEPATTIRELARVFEENEISGAPVVDQNGAVVGVVSQTDLVRRCSEGVEGMPRAYLFEMLFEQDEESAADVPPEQQLRVEDLMTEDPLMVPAETSAGTIAHLMFERRVHRVIVVDGEGAPLGIITSLDLLGSY